MALAICCGACRSAQAQCVGQAVLDFGVGALDLIHV
jgi:hypothetical protein